MICGKAGSAPCSSQELLFAVRDLLIRLQWTVIADPDGDLHASTGPPRHCWRAWPTAAFGCRVRQGRETVTDIGRTRSCADPLPSGDGVWPAGRVALIAGTKPAAQE